MRYSTLGAVVVVLGLAAAAGSAAAAGEQGEFHAYFDQWVVPADAAFGARLTVRARDKETRKPLAGLTIVVASSLDEGTLGIGSGARGASRQAEGTTDAGGEVQFTYRYDATLIPKGAAPKALPRRDKVGVSCRDYGYQEELDLGVGIDLIVKQVEPLHAPPFYALENVPVAVVLQDAWHPTYALGDYPELVAGAKLEVRVDGPPDEKVRPLTITVDEAFGDLFDKVLAGAGTAPRMGLGNADGLTLRRDAARGWFLRGRDGLPFLVPREGGDFKLSLTVTGLRGDGDPASRGTTFSLPVRQVPDSPFETCLRALTNVAPASVRTADRACNFYLDRGSFIALGRELGRFCEDLSKAVTVSGSPCPLQAEALEGLLFTYLVANALDEVAAMAPKVRQRFLARTQSGAGPAGAAAAASTDWIEPVLYGYLQSNPDKGFVLVQKRAGGESLGPAARLECAGGVLVPIERTKVPQSPLAVILETERFVAATLPSGGAATFKSRVGPSVLCVSSYSVDKDALVIMSTPLAATKASTFEYLPQVGGGATARLLDAQSGQELETLSPAVAASSIRAPEVAGSDLPSEACLDAAPSKAVLPWRSGDLSVDPKRCELSIDGATSALPEPAGDKLVVPLDEGARPGIHTYAALVVDKLGQAARLRAHYVVKERPAAPGEQARWTPGMRTSTTVPTPTPRAKPSPTPRPTPRLTPPPAPTPESPGEEPTPEPTVQPTPAPEHITDALLYGRATPAPSTPAPLPTAAAPLPQPSVAAPAGVRILSVAVCRSINDGEAVGAAETFDPAVGRVFCWFEFENTTATPAEATVEWTYFLRGAWKVILTSPQLLPVGSGSAYSPVGRGGGKPFPTGDYRVYVRVGGVTVDVVQFAIAP